MGVAYHVLNEVEEVKPGSPAAKAGLEPGDVIVRAVVNPPAKEVLRKLKFEQPTTTIDFKEEDLNWPALMLFLNRRTLPGTTLDLTFSRHGKEETVKGIELVEAAGWFDPARGLLFEPLTFDLRANSVGEAVSLGGQETLEALTLVDGTVRAISKNKVSLRLVAGPWTILTMALAYADQGNARLLLFLTLLSANLAVLNFLPIPLLDGGHFVLLCYEGIRGKPAPESVQIVLSYIGLILVLTLMVWALGLDVGLFPRR